MTATAETSVLRGGRWLHVEPTPEEVRDWFLLQPLHDGMMHERYASGVVLIPASEKHWSRQEKPGTGEMIDVESHRRTWTPYVSVSTRINYFRDYVRLLNGGRHDGPFKGKIKAVKQPRIASGPLANLHLPNGFSLYAVAQGDSLVPYVVCTIKVQIIERASKEVLIEGEDSRQVPAGDPYALMKARTGAEGRALGVAGMLVIGTGVASAEEAQEAESAPSTPAYARAQLPDLDLPQPDTGTLGDDELVAKARALHGRLPKDPMTAFDAWYRDRGFGSLEDLATADLQTVVRKLERDIDEIERSQS